MFIKIKKIASKQWTIKCTRGLKMNKRFFFKGKQNWLLGCYCSAQMNEFYSFIKIGFINATITCYDSLGYRCCGNIYSNYAIIINIICMHSKLPLIAQATCDRTVLL